MKALLFSGQGSQYVGMIKDVYEARPEAKALIDIADELFGEKLSSICFDGPLETLKETRYTQPAIFLHSAALVETLGDKLVFDATAGHSVGEYAALFAAKVLSFEDAFNLVKLRGKLMFEAGLEQPGTMFAVIGASDEKVIETCEELTQKGDGAVVVAANFNSPGQIVVSGSAQYLRENAAAFKQVGAKIIKELVVSGAFHSPLMEPAKEKLREAIERLKFSDAEKPVYANVSAEPLIKADDLKASLIAQLTSPVLWTQTLLNMREAGIEEFVEIGPGKVLQGLTKRTLKGVKISGIDNNEDIEKY